MRKKVAKEARLRFGSAAAQQALLTARHEAAADLRLLWRNDYAIRKDVVWQNIDGGCVRF